MLLGFSLCLFAQAAGQDTLKSIINRPVFDTTGVGGICGDELEVERPAINAALQWEFKPVESDGKTVEIAVAVPFEFKLTKQLLK